MKKALFLILPLLFIITNCENESPTIQVGTVPELSDVLTPDKLYTVSAIDHYISVHVEDPQGRENISQVSCSIYNSGNTSSTVAVIQLHDDGAAGDIIPIDGTFTSAIAADSLGATDGTFTLTFLAEDADGNISEPLSAELIVVDGEENLVPSIANFTAPQFAALSDTLPHFVSVEVSDPQGLNDIDAVVLTIYNQTSSNPVNEYRLYDDATNGDVTANNGLFSLLLNPGFHRNQIGTFTFHVQAFDKAEAASNPLTQRVKVLTYQNDPPFVFNMVAPDTMNLLPDAAASTVLQVSVTDPQGLSDIYSVFFNTFKPDNEPSSGNPFKMADDGQTDTNGDETAGDGVYSLRIFLPSDTQTGNYTFIFEAEDQSEARSNQITHIITVAE